MCSCLPFSHQAKIMGKSNFVACTENSHNRCGEKKFNILNFCHSIQLIRWPKKREINT